MEKPKIGVIGFGFVGRAVTYGFELNADVKAYDKYGDSPNTLEDTVRYSDFIFVCVPTPMDNDGNQDLSYMEDAINSIASCERRAAKDERKIIIIKSTVLPGTTRQFSEDFEQFDFVFNPEFLTQRVAKLDFINQSRIIIGGNVRKRFKIAEIVARLYEYRFGNSTPIFTCSWEEAELVKYISNTFFAVKVSFCNEIFELAERFGIEYPLLRDMWLADWRVARSHTDVPGHDGDFGYGGKCFPKDVQAFIKLGERLGVPMNMAKAADKVNERVRRNKDWLEIEGATSDCKFEEKE